MKRRGNSDYVDTDRGPRPVRVFNPAAGTWRVTALGGRWFGSEHAPHYSEVVMQLPVKFYTQKRGGGQVMHRGWFPVTDLAPPTN